MFKSIGLAPSTQGSASILTNVVITALLFLLPLSAHDATAFGYVCISLLLVGCVYIGFNWRALLLSRPVKLFLFGSLAFPLASAISMWVHGEWQWFWFDNPSRLILVLPVFLLLMRVKVNVVWLLVGILISACMFGVTAIYQHHFLGIGRVNGWITELRSPITFGNAALLFSVLSLGSMLMLKNWAARFLAVVACGLAAYASLLSGARGGWVSIPFLAMVLLSTGSKRPALANMIALGITVVVLAAAYTLIDSVATRVDQAVRELMAMYEIGAFVSGSVGQRIQMWWAAILLFLDNPIWGVGLGNYYETKLVLIEQGLISSDIQRFGYAHSEPFHYLAEIGLIGLLSLAVYYVTCFWLAVSHIKVNRYLAMMALLVLVLRFDIGLTQVQFVYHYTTLLYAMMFAVIAGLMCNPHLRDSQE